MVRYDNLWKDFLTFENFYAAYLEARKNKRYRPNVLIDSKDIESVIFDMLHQLENNTWKPKGYYVFETRNEVKRRIIHAPTFQDRVLHHALYRQIAPLFEKKFIYDSYANRKGKGIHQAVKHTQKFLRSFQKDKPIYVLQCDITKYYPSIDKAILLTQLSRTIKDKRILNLLKILIMDYCESGIPLGALVSQLFANIYLNPFDHYIKDHLRVRHYLRYMDDFLILYPNKEYLWNLLSKINKFLYHNLKLYLNPKTKIYPANQGIDFCGYRIWRPKIRPRKRNVLAARRRFKKLRQQYEQRKITLRDIQSRVSSFKGYMKHCDSFCTYHATLSVLGNTILEATKKSWQI